MAAVLHGQQGYARIGVDRRVIEHPEGDQGIILGLDQQRRYPDALQELVRRLGAKVIRRDTEAEKPRGVMVVEILNGLDFRQVFQSIDVRSLAILTPDAIF